MKLRLFPRAYRRLIYVAVSLLAISAAAGPGPERKSVDPTLTHRENAYLDQQAAVLLKAADDTLNRIPPQWPDSPERRLALLLLDGILHDIYAPQRTPVQAFFHARMERVAAELEEMQPAGGMIIWKLYNHAFIVRTASVTIAFDMTRGLILKAADFRLDKALAERLVRQCDVLFISHLHGDHVDETLAKAFLSQGKPVITPPNLWEGRPIYAQITHLERNADAVQPVAVRNGTVRIDAIIYPGHQNGLINNVALITTPEGLSVCHAGDQSNEQDFAWIDTVAQKHRVDVLLPNNWTTDLPRLASGMQPRLVITGHENELGHDIGGRRANWYSYARLENCPCPYIVMTWGERFHYLPPPQ